MASRALSKSPLASSKACLASVRPTPVKLFRRLICSISINYLLSFLAELILAADLALAAGFLAVLAGALLAALAAGLALAGFALAESTSVFLPIESDFCSDFC